MTQQTHESEARTPETWQPGPLGRRCPSIDAQTLYLVAIGEVSLQLPIAPVNAGDANKESEGSTLPMAALPAGYNEPRQPLQADFDAWAISQLAGYTHPWQAPAVSPRPPEEAEGDARTSLAG